MKILTVLGARPQFIKAAPVSSALRGRHEEILVHTGQHYDYEMSGVFFDSLDLPRPHLNLNVGSGSHGQQTGEMLKGLEQAMQAQRPDAVLVYGDTNSTLAGALAAAKLNIPVAHVEAGLRSFNRAMPEEANRVVTDHLSALLFCPTVTARDNLEREGIRKGVWLTGDVMYDAALRNRDRAARLSDVLGVLGLERKAYCLASVHRQGNTDDRDKLESLAEAFIALPHKVVFPVHPRTRARLEAFGLMDRLSDAKNILLSPPLGYLDFAWLAANACLIFTDSGGVQKEAFFYSVPCVTLREETEWVETVESGYNVLAGTDKARIVTLAGEMANAVLPPTDESLFGSGRAAERIVEILDNAFGAGS